MQMKYLVIIWTLSITNECVGGKKPVHKVEPVFDDEAAKIRVFLEDGSLSEYSVGELTMAEVGEELESNRKMFFLKFCLGNRE